MKHRSKSERIFQAGLYLFMAVLVLVTLYPLWYIFAASLSGAAEVVQGRVVFWFRDFNLDAYRRALQTDYVGLSYLNTIFYTVFGTALSMLLTILGSYALSKPRLHGRKFFMLFICLTMWFPAGLMPTYLTYQNLNLVDTRLGILLCGAVSSVYVIILRTYFESVPASIEESARLDGASELRVLWSVYLPLSAAPLMTLTLYYMVLRWNGYFWPMILLKDMDKIPLQVVLKKLIVTMSGVFDGSAAVSGETVVYAAIVIAAAPMLLFYPFLQKFFVRGVMPGTVKR